MSNLESRVNQIIGWKTSLEKWGEAKLPTALPAHRFGVHWIADQVRIEDKNYMSLLRPPVIKIVNPSRDRVLEALARIDPAGHVALRYHPISEQQAELAADPVGLGKRHAEYWIKELATTYREFDKKKLAVMGINEPTIHNGEDEIRVARYTESFLNTLKPYGIRAWVFNFSVGWPRESNGSIIWTNFLYLEELINKTDSFACVHEYWYPDVLNGWNSYANRVSRSPMRCKFIIGECGYTRQLAGLPQPWGWRGNISAEQYADQLWRYHDSVDRNRVFAICPFTTSFGGKEWESKDTLPAHEAILSRKRNFNWSEGWPITSPGDPDGDLPVKEYSLVWPKAERITQWYGPSHTGLDIAEVMRTPLYAMYDGEVAWVDRDTAANGGYGLYIRIHYPKLGFDSMFAHCDEVMVAKGDKVTRGQLVAYSGNSGNSTGPHLHLEIRMKKDGSTADRVGVGPFGRGQVDPLAVKWALHNLFGHEDR